MTKHIKTKLVRTEHLNHSGTLFGGYMMMWADEMAYVAASLEYPNGTFVTKQFGEFDFKSPVKNGDIIEISSYLDGAHITSVHVVVKAINLRSGKEVFKTTAVMVNFDGKEKRALINGN